MKDEAGMNKEAKKLKRERVGEWRKRDRRPKGGHTEAQIDRNRVDGRLNSSNRPSVWSGSTGKEASLTVTFTQTSIYTVSINGKQLQINFT